MTRTPITSFPFSFGSLIRDRRLKLGLSMHHLGDLRGYSTSHVGQIESGYIRNLPSPEKLAALAKGLQLDIGALIQAAGYEAELSQEANGS
jgi:transcriptional regulator with XRE-family HTH domain